MHKDKADRDFRYADILYRPHHRSSDRPQMRLAERAAMFMPFAALHGYEARLCEVARHTTARRELSEEEQQILNEQGVVLQRWLEHRRQRCAKHQGGQPEDFPLVTVTYFIPDRQKRGGSYCRETVFVCEIRPAERCLCLVDGRRLALDDIVALTGTIFSPIAGEGPT